MKNCFIEEIIDRVKILTGKCIKVYSKEHTVISCDDIEFIITIRDWIEYKNTIELHGIDLKSDFTSILIKKFKLIRI